MIKTKKRNRPQNKRNKVSGKKCNGKGKQLRKRKKSCISKNGGSND